MMCVRPAALADTGRVGACEAARAPAGATRANGFANEPELDGSGRKKTPAVQQARTPQLIVWLVVRDCCSRAVAQALLAPALLRLHRARVLSRVSHRWGAVLARWRQRRATLPRMQRVLREMRRRLRRPFGVRKEERRDRVRGQAIHGRASSEHCPSFRARRRRPANPRRSFHAAPATLTPSRALRCQHHPLRRSK